MVGRIYHPTIFPLVDFPRIRIDGSAWTGIIPTDTPASRLPREEIPEICSGVTGVEALPHCDKVRQRVPIEISIAGAQVVPSRLSGGRLASLYRAAAAAEAQILT